MTDREYPTHPAVNFLPNNATLILCGWHFYFFSDGVQSGGVLFLVFPDVKEHFSSIDDNLVIMEMDVALARLLVFLRLDITSLMEMVVQVPYVADIEHLLSPVECVRN